MPRPSRRRSATAPATACSVDYAVETEPLGTAGAIANCADKLDDGSFFVFNGDVLSDVDLTALAALHAGKGGMGTIFLTPVDDPRRYGLVELRDDGSVASFLEKPGEWEGTALINAGVYVLEHEVLEMIPRGRLFSIERGVFPRLAQAGSLYGYVDRGYWRDIGTPESYLQAHFDILERTVDTAVADMLGEQYLYVAAVGRHRRPGARRAAVLHRRERARATPAPASARWPSSAPAPWSLKARRSSSR